MSKTPLRNIKFEQQNLVQVINLGKALGRNVHPGTVIVLSGDLGAGKTQLAAAIAVGLGIDKPITSPTFAILKNYTSGRIPLNHMDLYRLETPDQLDDLDFWDLCQTDEPSATLIEWGDMFDEVTDKADLIVTLGIVSDREREVELMAFTEAGTELIKKAIEGHA